VILENGQAQPVTFDNMHIDETTLSQKYNLVKFNVISSTQISSRTAAIIAKLEVNENDGKPTLVALSTKARTATKLISIVEIAKRELAAKGRKCFQYNALSSEMIEMERNSKSGTTGAKQSATKEGGSESEDAFEAMGAPRESGTKKRLIPVMTTYLCAASVKELKNVYG
jgi:hypothetical protein